MKNFKDYDYFCKALYINKASVASLNALDSSGQTGSKICFGLVKPLGQQA